MAIKVGVLGSGSVGEVLANGFIAKGYPVIRGSRDPQKLLDWKVQAQKKWPKASIETGSFEDSAKSELLVLALKGVAVESVVKSLGSKLLANKTILDATNPIKEAPPVNGVLPFFTDMNFSLMERLQKAVPEAHFVKAFSCVGNAHMIDPKFATKPTMFICGNNSNAKQQTREVLSQFGWETEDMGAVEAARAIEPLCMLWCIPGIANGKWGHAFKLLKIE